MKIDGVAKDFSLCHFISIMPIKTMTMKKFLILIMMIVMSGIAVCQSMQGPYSPAYYSKNKTVINKKTPDKSPPKSKATQYVEAGTKKLNSGDNTGAISLFNKAIELQDNYSYAFYCRAIAKYNLEDYRGVVADCNIAIKLIPILFIGSYILRGQAFGLLGRYEDAYNDFTTAINILPENSNGWYERGKLELVYGNKDNACLDLSKAGELGEKDAYKLIKSNCN